MDNTKLSDATNKSSTLAGKKETSLHELLANTVIYTLTRDKKLPQPAGMAPAGSRSATADTSESQARGNATGGTQPPPADGEDEDPLAAAAAAAAARMGLSAADLNAIRNADRATSIDQVQNNNFKGYFDTTLMSSPLMYF